MLHIVGQTEQQVGGFADDLFDTGVRAVHLVHAQDDRQLGFECLTQHETGLRQRAFGGVHEQHDAVDHGDTALDLATEIGVAGGIDDVEGDASGWPYLAASGPVYSTAVFLARMVMPFSRSRSLESITRSGTSSRSLNTWDC